MLAQASQFTLGRESLVFWGLAALVAIGAGYVQGFTGMGFAVVSTPLLVLLVYQPHQVVMLSLLLGSVLSAAILVETRRSLKLRRAWLLIVGAVLGTPVGVALFSHADPRVLTIVIATTALATAVIWAIRLPRPVRRERTAVSIAGALGGFLNGATSIGGPPPALVVSMQRWDVSEGRAALAAFNLTSYVIGLVVGVSSQDIGFLTHGLVLLPIAAIGSVLGARSVRSLSPRAFRYALLGTVWLAGLSAVASALR